MNYLLVALGGALGSVLRYFESNESDSAKLNQYWQELKDEVINGTRSAFSAAWDWVQSGENNRE